MKNRFILEERKQPSFSRMDEEPLLSLVWISLFTNSSSYLAHLRAKELQKTSGHPRSAKRWPFLPYRCVWFGLRRLA
ncbi:hypothetical protein MHYP_G00290810 [Metynnis hypsauchen]